MSKHKGPDLAKSCERQFIHRDGYTIIVCRFDFESPAHTVVVKKGLFTTFGDFMRPTHQTLFKASGLSKDEALKKAERFIDELI